MRLIRPLTKPTSPGDKSSKNFDRSLTQIRYNYTYNLSMKAAMGRTTLLCYWIISISALAIWAPGCARNYSKKSSTSTDSGVNSEAKADLGVDGSAGTQGEIGGTLLPSLTTSSEITLGCVINYSDLAFDSSDNLYLFGTLRGGCTLNDASSTTVTEGDWRQSLIISSYDSNKKLRWLKRLACKGGDCRAHQMAITTDGEMTISGLFSDRLDLGGQELVAQQKKSTLFLAAFSAIGEYRWGRALNQLDYMYYYDNPIHAALTLDGNGNAYVATQIKRDEDFGGGVLVNEVNTYSLALASYSSDGAFRWHKQFRNDAANTTYGIYPYSMIATIGDKICLSGYYYKGLDLGGGTLTSTNQSGGDTFLGCLDSNGGHLWSKVPFSSGWARSLVMTTDPSGNLHIAGTYMGALTIPGVGTVSGTKNDEAFVASANANGVFNHILGLSGPMNDFPAKLSFDNGTIFVAGTFGDSITAGAASLTGYNAYTNNGFLFGINANDYTVRVSKGLSTVVSSSSIKVANTSNHQTALLLNGTAPKFDAAATATTFNDNGVGFFASDGTYLSALLLTTYFRADFQQIAIDRASNTYAITSFLGKHTAGQFNLSTADLSKWQRMLISYGPDRKVRWIKNLPSSDAGVSYDLLTADSQGNLYLAGYCRQVLNFGDGQVCADQKSGSFVVSLNSSGAFRWGKFWRGWTTLYDLASDGNNNLYLVGEMREAVLFDNTLLTPNGADILLLSLDADGQFRWAKNFGETGADIGYGIAVDGQNRLYIAGQCQWAVNFGGGPTDGGDELEDIFVASFNADGSFRWSRRYGGPDKDIGSSIAADSVGNVFVTGSFKGTASFGSQSITTGNSQVFFLSLDQAGQLRWLKKIIGDGSLTPPRALVDRLGQAYLLTDDNQTIDFGGGPLTGSQISIAQYAPDGRLRRSHGYGARSFTDALIDAEDKLYVSGGQNGMSFIWQLVAVP